MNRRQFLKSSAATTVLSTACSRTGSSRERPDPAEVSAQPISRVRPGDPLWPPGVSWEKLRQEVGGRLIEVKSPLSACRTAPNGANCTELFKEMKNPYYVGDQPALTQTSGWVDAWTSAPSAYAVAAEKTDDIVAAVNFAREHNLRLVVKGGGHSYQGTSNAADSLLIWTRAMDGVISHDAFIPHGCAGTVAPQPAVTVEAGAIWIQVYGEVTTRGGRYVQGGGCATVGVAGLVQSGGFGSFSKNYGLAAAGLLEAEVVTADGLVRIANACTNPELFWALKGGGGGSFGVVARLTLRTRELPDNFGRVSGTIRANSDAAFRKLIARTLGFYNDQLFNPHWGEQIRFGPTNTLQFHMASQGLNLKEAEEAWQPFLAWVASAPRDFAVEKPVAISVLPARHYWDPGFLERNHPDWIIRDDRPDAPASNILWAGSRAEAGRFIHGFRSVWLPESLLKIDQQGTLADALFACSRHWRVSLHFNKGLAGARADDRAAAKDTAMNSAVLDAFALAIIGGGSEPAFPGIPGHEPDVAAARRDADAIYRAAAELLGVVKQPGSYVSESDFFERSWQESFWGANYPRLAAVKKQYDPEGLFFVHHGVGSDEWSADGFNKLAAR